MPISQEVLINQVNAATENVQSKVSRRKGRKLLIGKPVPANFDTNMRDIHDKLRNLARVIRELPSYPEDDDQHELEDNFLHLFNENLMENLSDLKSNFKRHHNDLTTKKLSRFCVTLHFMAMELQKFFPDGAFNNNITWAKKRAEKWWHKHFSKALTVQWDEFANAFTASFPNFNSENLDDLNETICLISSERVSQFEFDIFTRLFGPWKKMDIVWITLIKHPGYIPRTTFTFTEELLRNSRGKIGSYLFRMSLRSPGFWAISYFNVDSSIGQALVFGLPLADTLMFGSDKKLFVYPNGEKNIYNLEEITNLRERKRIAPEIKTKPEDSEDDDISETTCSICFVNPRIIKLEPCGHLCCYQCCRNWLGESISKKLSSPTCPFCRKSILSTSLVEFVYKQSAVPPA